jgi:hypothetical protein
MNPTMKIQELDFQLNQTVLTIEEAHISKLTQANMTKVKCMWLRVKHVGVQAMPAPPARTTELLAMLPHLHSQT